jgi:hypothetical protein
MIAAFFGELAAMTIMAWFDIVRSSPIPALQTKSRS